MEAEAVQECFKKRKDAEAFAAVKRVEMVNQGRKRRPVLPAPGEAQHEEAREAIDRLGSTYTLHDAVDSFLKQKYERHTDQRTLKLDHGPGLIDYRRWLYRIVQESTKVPEKKNISMTPGEIEE